MLAWRREQNSNALLLWGGGYLLGALSLALVASRGTIPDVLSIEVGIGAVLLSYGFWLAGTRAFNGRETPPTAFLIAPLIWLIAMRIPAVQADITLRIIIVTLCQCVMTGCVIYEFWRERAEPLLSRWPIDHRAAHAYGCVGPAPASRAAHANDHERGLLPQLRHSP